MINKLQTKQQLISEFTNTFPTTEAHLSSFTAILKTFLSVGIEFKQITGGSYFEGADQIYWQSWKVMLAQDTALLCLEAKGIGNNEIADGVWRLVPLDSLYLSAFWSGVDLKFLLEDCSEQIPSTRKTRRTIVRITNLDKGSDEATAVVEAIVPGWNPHETIRFPASFVPGHLRDVLKPNIHLFAHVNTGAEKADDLYFEKFELAPEPDEDGLA